MEMMITWRCLPVGRFFCDSPSALMIWLPVDIFLFSLIVADALHYELRLRITMSCVTVSVFVFFCL
jgi:hypothetical protein